MIDTNELRLGNWISVKYGKDIFTQVIGLSKKFVTVQISGSGKPTDKNIFSKRSFNINPIPLTPGILEKCREQLSEIKTVLLIVEDIKANTWWFGIDITVLLTEIKYVHQFQNCYYSLTQSELKINL